MDLVPNHAYEIVTVDRGTVSLHNPWGTRHPEPMTIQELLDSITPYFVTLHRREQ